MKQGDQHFAVILAAGASTRMGQCKARLPWFGTTLLQYQIGQFWQSRMMPIVVLGPHNAEMAQTIEATAVINSNPQAGKVSSLQTGLQAIPLNCESVILSAVDQPRPREVYDRLLAAYQHSSAPIVAPIYADRIGHPLLFSGQLLPDLLSIREETQGLRQIVNQWREQIQTVPFHTPIVLCDLNTPKTYDDAADRFRAFFAGEATGC